VNKFVQFFLVLAIVACFCTPVMAQPTGTAPAASIEFSNFFGIGLVVIGAAMGIGKLAASAYESMSRQPEVAGNIQTAMIIAAALIEGFTFYALFLCTPK
jgi:F-type H+-transporting ATPase subunit c